MIILAIDGGGSKTEAIALNDKADVLGRGLAGPSNPNVVGLKSCIEAILLAARRALKEGGLEKADILVAGIAGAGRFKTKSLIKDSLSKTGIAKKYLIFSDAEIYLVASTRGSSGIMVNSGTGMIVLGMDDRGRIARSGGWGYLIDDEGSGFWIGREALNAVFRSLDGRGPPTLLSEEVLRFFNSEDFDDLIIKIYSSLTPTDISKLTHVVDKLYETDGVSRDIVRRAAQELAKAVEAVRAKLNLRYPVKVYCVGGAFEMKSLLSEFERALGDKYLISKVKLSPVVGAAILGLKELHGGKIDKRLLDKIYLECLRVG